MRTASRCLVVLFGVLLGLPASADEEAQPSLDHNAAAMWNERFGTHLEVDPQASSGQRVPVVFSDLVCGFANGITRCFDSIEVQVCTLDAVVPHRLQAVFLHELGHVLNIRDHADDPRAVMHAESSGGKHFGPADYRLFTDANPGFY